MYREVNSAFTFDPADPNFLRSEDVANAKLFPHRFEMISYFGQLNPGSVLEIGVGFGKLSTFILEQVRPTKFVAVDIFHMHLGNNPFWGKTPDEWFQGQTHRQLYESRLSSYSDTESEILEGLSHEVVATLPSRSFDLVYVDADHRPDSVRRDAVEAVRVLKDSGVLIFNDYIYANHDTGEAYGVVQEANHLVKSGQFEIVGFALSPQMFCDIALQRR